MENLTYTPHARTGYSCELTSPDGHVLRLARAIDSEVTHVEGDEALVANQTLVGGLAAFARNEHESRITRQPDRRKLLRKSAQEAEDLIVSLINLTDDVGDETVAGFCSGCLVSTDHRRIVRRMVPAAYLCTSCGAATTTCAAPNCEHLARRSTRQVGLARYCAEHRHEIPSFQRLDDTLPSLTDYESWLGFDSRNARRLTTIAGGALGGALLVGPAFFAAAPALGGYIGAWTGLSGAAASSHGLALLGGGAVSAGGLGVAGGTAIVTAVGTGLGTGMGASITTAYVGDDDSFGIELVDEGSEPAVVFSSGFLTEQENGWELWERIIRARYPDRAVYRLKWGAKELTDLASLVGRGVGSGKLVLTAAKRATRATKTAGTRLGVLGGLIAGYGVAKNPWSVARTRADMTGAVLADLIARTDATQFVLVGHSLGARMMMEAAQTLGTKNGAPRIEDVHLLGAAIDSKLDLRPLDKAVSGTIYNYWSNNDAVLNKIYRTAQRGERAAGAEGFARRSPVVRNRNVSRLVDSHSAYVDKVTLQ
ncbi:MAG: DUF726 domain-containing protein [Acidimicrobiaceae bacterium]|nr:DUF726 domain-containing protein [Acidimicrobiaceae bacterium]